MIVLSSLHDAEKKVIMPSVLILSLCAGKMSSDSCISNTCSSSSSSSRRRGNLYKHHLFKSISLNSSWVTVQIFLCVCVCVHASLALFVPSARRQHTLCSFLQRFRLPIPFTRRRRKGGCGGDERGSYASWERLCNHVWTSVHVRVYIWSSKKSLVRAPLCE